MTKLKPIFFGGVDFPENEEYQAFQLRLLYALLLMGIFFSGLFILPDTDLQGALALAEKLRRDIEELMSAMDGTRLKITASIGVARNLPHHRATEDIQRDADQAMYRAKQAGRNRVTSLA